MHYSSRLPAVLLVSALVLGCGDQPESPSNLSLRTEHNPEGFGAVVIHAEQGAFLTGGDGLVMMIGWTFDELQEFCATGDVTIGSLKELFVFRPDGSLKYGLRGARIPLLVWQTDNFDLCASLDVPHLTGTGNFSASDNDYFVSGTRTESVVTNTRGHVTSGDGERFQFTNAFHAVILRTGEVHKFVNNFELRPIGN